ncbi:MAG: PKD domain-containing protein [Syntrophales bacterium]
MNMRPQSTFIFIMMLGALLAADSAPAQSQPQVTSIEVNQGLGVQKGTNKFYVAGKNTVVQAFLNQAVAIDTAKTYVNVSRPGKPDFKIYAKKADGNVSAVSTVDFLCKSMTTCENWAAGPYTFQPYINGTAGSASSSYEFKTGTKIRVLAVAVTANYGTDGTKSVSDAKWKTMGDFMQTVYPLAEGDLKWTIRPTVLDKSGADYNLQESKGDGQENLSKALANLIPVKCKTSPQSEGCYDFVLGFIKEHILQDDGNKVAGYTYPGLKSLVVVAGDEDAPGTVAHELAHQYGIGDTYDDKASSTIRCSVNPAPNGFWGRDWDKGAIGEISCNDGRLASTLMGSDGETIINGAQVAAADHPYEITGRGILTEMADFMSASGALQKQLWITKDVYDWLFRRLVTQEAGLKKKTLALAASATAQRFASFSGSLSKTDTVKLNLWKSYTDTVTLGDSTGALQVSAVNAAGSVVASSAFTVQFFMVSPPRNLAEAPFQGVINFPADTAKFQIVKDGAVLAEVPVSDNLPVVADVTPKTATTLSGSYAITWTGSDPDGENLTYTVEYNPDVTNTSSAWMVLADELEALSWTEDFSLLPGGNHAKIRVTVNDGVLSASAESAEFIVPLRKPEIFLDELPWGNVYSFGSDLLLVGDAFDPQDEWLPDEKLKWTSSISGDLGSGAELIVSNLAIGTHTITLTATNSAGLSSSATVSVQVTPIASTSTTPPPSTTQAGEKREPGNCFIATAAFGSYLHPYVGMLREFRDTFLLTNSAGQAFVGWYYRVSPPLAALIAQEDYARAGVRLMLLPAVGFSALALNLGLFWSMFILLAFLLLSGMGIRKLVRMNRGSYGDTTLM